MLVHNTQSTEALFAALHRKYNICTASFPGIPGGVSFSTSPFPLF